MSTETEASAPEVPATPAGSLGITQEAFDGASAALADIVEGGVSDSAEEAPPVEEAPAPAPTPDPKVKAEAKPEPEEKKPETADAKAWAALKKKDAALSAMSARLRDEKAALEKQREQLTASQKSQADIIAMLKQDPRNIEKFGISMPEFLDRLITDNAEHPAQAKRENSEEFKSLRAELAEMKNLLMSHQVSTAEEKFGNTFESVIQGEEFELLRAHENPKSAALKFMGEYYQTYGKMDLTPQQIARHLQDTWKEHLESLGSSKAVRKALGISDDVVEEPEIEEEPIRKPARKPTPKTVTPAMRGSPTRSAHARPQTTLPDDAEVRAAAALVPKEVWDQIE